MNLCFCLTDLRLRGSTDFDGVCIDRMTGSIGRINSLPEPISCKAKNVGEYRMKIVVNHIALLKNDDKDPVMTIKCPSV